MHILTLNMRRPHTFCAYIGLRKLKLLFTCEIFAFYLFVGCFVNIFWKIQGKKLQLGGLREDRAGNSKHKYLFFRLIGQEKKKQKNYGSVLFS